MKGRSMVAAMLDLSPANCEILNRGQCVLYIPKDDELGLESEKWTIAKCSVISYGYLNNVMEIETTFNINRDKCVFRLEAGNLPNSISIEQMMIYEWCEPEFREFTEEFSKSILIDYGVVDRRNVRNCAIESILCGTQLQQYVLGYMHLNLEIQSFL